MKKLFFIGLLLLCKAGATQVLFKDSILPIKNIIKFAPFNLIDPLAPNIEFSYERMLNSKYSAQISLAAITAYNGLYENYKRNETGFRVKLEGRYYTQGYGNIKKPLYLALEGSHMYQEEDRILTFTDCNDCEGVYSEYPILQTDSANGMTDTLYQIGSLGYDDTVRIYRNHTIINLKFGLQEALSERFVLDAYFGIGLKFRSVKHARRIKNEDEIYYDSNHPSSRRNEQRNSVVLSLPINIKIGYRF